MVAYRTTGVVTASRQRFGLSSSRILRLLLGTTMLTSVVFAPGTTFALPPDGSAAPIANNGTASFDRTTTPNTLIVTQGGSDRVIIDWPSFNIDGGETVRFAQPSAQAIALNRVAASGGRSDINGTLTANGHVWLINPNGIMFGSGAVINTAGFLGTSINIVDDANFTNFLNDTNNTFQFANGINVVTGNVENNGTNLTFSGAGYAALVAPHVRNQGTIVGQVRQLVIGGVNGYTIDLTGDGLIQFQPNLALGVPGIGPLVENTGTIRSDVGGQILISAVAADALVSTVINLGGIVAAQSVLASQGQIILDGGPVGTVTVAGNLDTSAGEGDATDGTITISGHDIAISNDNAIPITVNAGLDAGVVTLNVTDATGGVNQTGAIAVQADALAILAPSGATGTVNMPGDNDVNTLASQNFAQVTYHDVNDLTVDTVQGLIRFTVQGEPADIVQNVLGVTATGAVAISTANTGNLTVDQAISGGSVTLTADGTFNNTATGTVIANAGGITIVAANADPGADPAVDIGGTLTASNATTPTDALVSVAVANTGNLTVDQAISGGSVNLTADGTFNNTATGTVTANAGGITIAAANADPGADPAVDIGGTLTASNATTPTDALVSVAAANTGNLNVGAAISAASASLSAEGTFTSSTAGTISASAGDITITASDFNFDTGGAITSPGTVTFAARNPAGATPRLLALNNGDGTATEATLSTDEISLVTAGVRLRLDGSSVEGRADETTEFQVHAPILAFAIDDHVTIDPDINITGLAPVDVAAIEIAVRGPATVGPDPSTINQNTLDKLNAATSLTLSAAGTIDFNAPTALRGYETGVLLISSVSDPTTPIGVSQTTNLAALDATNLSIEVGRTVAGGAAGDITLNQAANTVDILAAAVSTPGPFAGIGDFSYQGTGDLTIGTVNLAGITVAGITAAGAVSVTTTDAGNINVEAAISAGSVSLSADGTFANTAAGTINATADTINATDGRITINAANAGAAAGPTINIGGTLTASNATTPADAIVSVTSTVGDLNVGAAISGASANFSADGTFANTAAGTINATAGGITINAANAGAATGPTINIGGTLSASNAATPTDASVSVTAANTGNLNVGAAISAASASLAADGTFANTAAGTINATAGGITINAANADLGADPAVDIGGTLTANNGLVSVTTTGAGNLDVGAAISAASASLSADGTFANTAAGTINTNAGGITVTAANAGAATGPTINIGGTLTASNATTPADASVSVTSTAGDLNVAAAISGASAILSADGTFANSGTGTVTAANAVSVTTTGTGNLNVGAAISGGSATLSADGTFANTAAGTISTNAGGITVNAANAGAATGPTINIGGTLTASNATIPADAIVSVTSTTGDLNVAAAISGASANLIADGDFTNSGAGTVTAANAVSVTTTGAGNLNVGAAISGGSATLSADGTFANTAAGTINTNAGGITITAANAGAATGPTINIGGTLTASNAATPADAIVSVTAANTGNLNVAAAISGASATLAADGTFANTATGTISTNVGGITINAANADPGADPAVNIGGTLTASNAATPADAIVSVTAANTGNLNVAAAISGASATFAADGTFTNTAAGTVTATAGDTTIRAANLNIGGLIDTRGGNAIFTVNDPAGNVSETGVGAVRADALAILVDGGAAGTGTVSLSGANDVNTLATETFAQVTYHDVNDVTVGQVTVAQEGGDVTVNGVRASGAGITGNAIDLSAVGTFTNTTAGPVTADDGNIAITAANARIGGAVTAMNATNTDVSVAFNVGNAFANTADGTVTANNGDATITAASFDIEGAVTATGTGKQIVVDAGDRPLALGGGIATDPGLNTDEVAQLNAGVVHFIADSFSIDGNVVAFDNVTTTGSTVVLDVASLVGGVSEDPGVGLTAGALAILAENNATGVISMPGTNDVATFATEKFQSVTYHGINNVAVGTVQGAGDVSVTGVSASGPGVTGNAIDLSAAGTFTNKDAGAITADTGNIAFTATDFVIEDGGAITGPATVTFFSREADGTNHRVLALAEGTDAGEARLSPAEVARVSAGDRLVLDGSSVNGSAATVVHAPTLVLRVDDNVHINAPVTGQTVGDVESVEIAVSGPVTVGADTSQINQATFDNLSAAATLNLTATGTIEFTAPTSLRVFETRAVLVSSADDATAPIGVTEAVGASLDAGNLGIEVGRSVAGPTGDILLNQPGNTVDVLAAGNTTGASAGIGQFAYNGSGNLEVGAVNPTGVTASNAIAVNVSGNLAVTQSMTSQGNLATASGGTTTVAAPVSANGPIQMQAGGDMTFDRPVTSGSTLGVFTGGTTTVAAPASASGSITMQTGGNMTVGQPVTAGSTLDVSAGGETTVAAPISASGPIRMQTGGNMTFDQPVTSGGTLDVFSGGATLINSILTSHAPGTSVVIDTGSFANTAGPDAIVAGSGVGADRYLIYSVNPDNDFSGGLVANILIGKTFAVNPPNTITQPGDLIIYPTGVPYPNPPILPTTADVQFLDVKVESVDPEVEDDSLGVTDGNRELWLP